MRWTTIGRTAPRSTWRIASGRLESKRSSAPPSWGSDSNPTTTTTASRPLWTATATAFGRPRSLTAWTSRWAPKEQLRSNFSNVTCGILPGVPDADGAPAGGTDGVRVGASRIVSMNPNGSATSGTIYLHGRHGHSTPYRVLGATGRIRILKFLEGSRQWIEPIEERRREARTAGSLVRRISALVRPGQWVLVLDLSPTGALVAALRPLRPGAVVHVHLASDGSKATIRASVVRCAVAAMDAERMVYHAALCFEEASEWVRERQAPNRVAVSRSAGARRSRVRERNTRVAASSRTRCCERFEMVRDFVAAVMAPELCVARPARRHEGAVVTIGTQGRGARLSTRGAERRRGVGSLAALLALSLTGARTPRHLRDRFETELRTLVNARSVELRDGVASSRPPAGSMSLPITLGDLTLGAIDVACEADAVFDEWDRQMPRVRSPPRRARSCHRARRARRAVRRCAHLA